MIETEDVIFIQASEDDIVKTLLKYYTKTLDFDLAYSKQRYRGNQAGKNDIKRDVNPFNVKRQLLASINTSTQTRFTLVYDPVSFTRQS